MSHKSPNEGLARLLTEAGWTYAQLARKVNGIATESGRPTRYDDSGVKHWLEGTMPRKEVRGHVLEAFSRCLMRPVTHAEAGFEAPDGTTKSLGTVEGLVELGSQDMDPSRRSVLGAALFSVALTIPDWPDVVGRAEVIATGKLSRIGSGEVDMVVQMTDRISTLDDQFGGRHARPMAAAFLVNTVAPYLQARATPEVRKAMMSAASDLCYLTGYMAVDEQLHGLGQRYYLKALELAGAAEDHLTYCTTLRGMSVQAVDQGHGAHSLRLADAAAAASPAAGPRMRAFLAGQQAHAAAQIGDKPSALRYMNEAERAMEKAESRARALGSYDPSSLNYHVSQVRFELGDVTGAVNAMQESDRLRFDVYRRSRVHHRGLLAQRLLRLGRLEEACATFDMALDDYPFVQSGRCDLRMRQMATLLAPHSKNAQARAALEKARSQGLTMAA